MSEPRRFPLPGMIAIALYLLVLAGVMILGAVEQRLPWLFLIVAGMFVTGALGLVQRFRWAWALAIAACLLLMVYQAWLFVVLRSGAALVEALLNLVFFLYLARADVRRLLR